MSGKRLGEDSQLRMVGRRRSGECQSSLGERQTHFTTMPEIRDFSPKPGVSGDVPDLEELRQGLRHGNECAGCRGN